MNKPDFSTVTIILATALTAFLAGWYSCQKKVAWENKTVRIISNETSEVASVVGRQQCSQSTKSDWDGEIGRVLCRDDLRLLESMASLASIRKKGSQKIAETLYEVVMSPLETVCSRKYKFGTGNGWMRDGSKVACVDDLRNGQPCIVYSLGLGGDISFEEGLAETGCEIYGYDATVVKKVLQRAANNKNIHVTEMSFGTKDALFQSELSKNGHNGLNLTYLKMDIEGSEVPLLTKLLNTGILQQFSQVAVEMHFVMNYLAHYRDIFAKLYSTGFRIISHACNVYAPASPTSIQEKGTARPHQCNHFEIVLMRKKSICEAEDALAADPQRDKS